MEENKIMSKISKILKNIRFRAIALCICLSFILWSFITFGDYRQHEFEVPIRFENSLKPDEIYHTKDSVVEVKVNATGFYFLFKNGFKARRETLDFDVNDLPLNRAKGEIRLSSNFLKAPIAKLLDMEDAKISLLPDTIYLKWQKKFSKQVPIVNRAKFDTKPSFRIEKEPEFLLKQIRIEGEKHILDKIDTIYTKTLSLSNINKTHIALIPLEINQQHQGVYFQTTNIPVKIKIEQVTERVVEVPIKIEKKGLEENVKVFPSTVSVKIRLPIKDFKKVVPEDFSFYVVCDKDMQNYKKLPVRYANIPENVEILEINPRRLNYIILND